MWSSKKTFGKRPVSLVRDLLGYRRARVLRYGGNGWRDVEGVRFSVRAAVRPGAMPTLVEGKAVPDGIDLLWLESSGTVIPRRKPRRLQPWATR